MEADLVGLRDAFRGVTNIAYVQIRNDSESKVSEAVRFESNLKWPLKDVAVQSNARCDSTSDSFVSVLFEDRLPAAESFAIKLSFENSIVGLIGPILRSEKIGSHEIKLSWPSEILMSLDLNEDRQLTVSISPFSAVQLGEEFLTGLKLFDSPRGFSRENEFRVLGDDAAHHIQGAWTVCPI